VGQIATRVGHQLPHPLLTGLGSIAKIALASVDRRRRMIATNRAIANLSSEQLRDAGFPEVPRPVIIVEARLMATLMAMR
jgi:hypothetical protein